MFLSLEQLYEMTSKGKEKQRMIVLGERELNRDQSLTILDLQTSLKNLDRDYVCPDKMVTIPFSESGPTLIFWEGREIGEVSAFSGIGLRFRMIRGNLVVVYKKDGKFVAHYYYSNN